ncbi:MAG TPA: hypothetical protein ENK21_00430 [Trueperaceae bacterium]|nr:hypothetical protein [Trueperaceae bacterium]
MNLKTSLPFFAIAIFLLLFSFSFIYYGFRAIKNKRFFGWFNRHMFALVLLLSSALFAIMGLSISAYKSLTNEQLAATIHLEKLSEQNFIASYDNGNGINKQFQILGDQFYIDAKIIKWRYLANVLGFKTIYQLDRLGGRYIDIAQERSKPRSLYSLEENLSFDLFDLQKRFPILQKLVDAEYGSASYLEAKDDTDYKVLVSTTGLLIRELP